MTIKSFFPGTGVYSPNLLIDLIFMQHFSFNIVSDNNFQRMQKYKKFTYYQMHTQFN